MTDLSPPEHERSAKIHSRSRRPPRAGGKPLKTSENETGKMEGAAAKAPNRTLDDRSHQVRSGRSEGLQGFPARDVRCSLPCPPHRSGFLRWRPVMKRNLLTLPSAKERRSRSLAICVWFRGTQVECCRMAALPPTLEPVQSHLKGPEVLCEILNANGIHAELRILTGPEAQAA